MGEQDGLSRGFCLDTLHGCSNTSHSTKVRNSCPTPKYLYIFFLVKISCFWKSVLIKLVDYLTFNEVIGTINTDVPLFS